MHRLIMRTQSKFFSSSCSVSLSTYKHNSEISVSIKYLLYKGLKFWISQEKSFPQWYFLVASASDKPYLLLPLLFFLLFFSFLDRYQSSDLVKLDILLNGQPVDAMATIVHKSKAPRVGRELVEKLKKFIDRFTYLPVVCFFRFWCYFLFLIQLVEQADVWNHYTSCYWI